MTPRGSEALRVFLLLFLSYAAFFQASTWGAASRFDLARALVEKRTVVIDDYHGNTGDKAFRDGHYYSDKAPLPSFLATPGIAIAHAVRGITGRPASHAIWLALAGGLAAAFASGLPTAAGGAAFFLALRDRRFDLRTARLVTFFVFLGTTLFPYGTLLQGHAPAAAWLFVFFHAAFQAEGAPSLRRAFAAGVAASAAFATDYATAPPLVVLGWLALLRHRDGLWRRKAAMAAGAIPGLLFLAVYHDVAFGGPFSFGYRYVVEPWKEVEVGRLGLGAPDPVVAVRLLFGPYRGLFFVCPVLLLALPGMVSGLRDRDRRLEAAAILFVPAYWLVLNSAHSVWHGGWAIGPRHLVPAIPFLGLGLAATMRPRDGSSWRRRAALVLGAVSVLFMFAATAVQPEVPETIRNPLFDHVLPHFFRGDLSIGEQGFGDLVPARLDPGRPDRWDAFSVGEVLGLPGLLALLPVLGLWVILLRTGGRRSVRA